jgi:2-polyprenyl-3-methyl-5-hydroxy-6-metoxy-1,4-benzoquinol methylase
MDEVRQNTLRIKDGVKADSLDWFEELYASANGDEYWIPWSNGEPHHFLTEWASKIKSRGRALVVGCGLGEDAAYLSRKGWNVTAFDISPSAIQWAKKVYSSENIDWQVADLLSLPEEWIGLFDLVVEVHILQAIPESIRILAAPNMAPLLAPSGQLVCIGRLNEKEEEYEGPPWPLSRNFIDSIGVDMKNVDFIKKQLPNDDPDVIRYRSVWERET